MTAPVFPCYVQANSPFASTTYTIALHSKVLSSFISNAFPFLLHPLIVLVAPSLFSTLGPFYPSPFFNPPRLIHFSTRTVDPASPLPRVHGTPCYAIGYEIVFFLNSIPFVEYFLRSITFFFFFPLSSFITKSLAIPRVFRPDICHLLP